MSKTLPIPELPPFEELPQDARVHHAYRKAKEHLKEYILEYGHLMLGFSRLGITFDKHCPHSTRRPPTIEEIGQGLISHAETISSICTDPLCRKPLEIPPTDPA